MITHPLFAAIDGSPITLAGYCDPSQPYRQCSRCVMDSTDPDFVAFPEGDCNSCRLAEHKKRKATANREHRLRSMLTTLRAKKSESDYDCIIGVSGGVDSSQCVVFAAENDLNPLVVHVDAGWNTRAAVENVERLCTRLDFDLETVVIDWEPLRSLQVAFLRAGVANQDTPQDHVLFGALYRTARKYGIRDVIEGRNWQTESILPPKWGHSAMDPVQIRAIARGFGAGSLAALPIMSDWEYHVTGPHRFGLTIHAPLMLIDYSSGAAKQRLQNEFDWADYGGKHHESRWTRFFQNYFLPHRFGYDKRKAHLSSRIVSGELTRKQAVSALSEPLYQPEDLKNDLDYIIRKLDMDPAEFNAVLSAPLRCYTDYPNGEVRVAALKRGIKVAKALRRTLNLAPAAFRKVRSFTRAG